MEECIGMRYYVLTPYEVYFLPFNMSVRHAKRYAVWLCSYIYTKKHRASILIEQTFKNEIFPHCVQSVASFVDKSFQQVEVYEIRGNIDDLLNYITKRDSSGIEVHTIQTPLNKMYLKKANIIDDTCAFLVALNIITMCDKNEQVFKQYAEISGVEYELLRKVYNEIKANMRDYESFKEMLNKYYDKNVENNLMNIYITANYKYFNSADVIIFNSLLFKTCIEYLNII